MTLDDLDDSSRMRIENLQELLDLRTRMRVDRAKGKELE